MNYFPSAGKKRFVENIFRKWMFGGDNNNNKQNNHSLCDIH